jgi:hypothetical protein
MRHVHKEFRPHFIRDLAEFREVYQARVAERP